MFNLLKMENIVPALQRAGRREPRHPTAASVTLSCPGLGMFEGLLVDLSRHGARLRARAKVAVDSPILLEIEGMPLLSGRVIWSQGQELGMCFDGSLHRAVLEHLLAKSGVRRA